MVVVTVIGFLAVSVSIEGCPFEGTTDTNPGSDW